MALVFKLKNPLPKKEKNIESYDPRIHGVRQSHISMWQACQEQARLGIILGYRHVIPGLPLVFGSLSHGYLKGLYRHIRDDEFTIESVKSSHGEWLDASEKEFLEENPNPSTAVRDSMELSLAILHRQLKEYVKYWYEEDTSEDIVWKMVEEKFQVPIEMKDGSIVPLIGTFDGSYTKNKNLWLFETKNKSRWSQDLGTMLPLDLQVGIYVTALRQLYNKVPTGVRYNLLRRPGERRKQTESLKDFSDRILDNICRDPSHYFERIDITFEKSELDQHVNRTISLVEGFYEWWKIHKASGLFEKDLMWNSYHCENKYGTCQFLGLCANGNTNGLIRQSPKCAAGSLSAE